MSREARLSHHVKMSRDARAPYVKWLIINFIPGADGQQGIIIVSLWKTGGDVVDIFSSRCFSFKMFRGGLVAATHPRVS